MGNKTIRLFKKLDKPACIILGIKSITGLSIIRNLGKHNITTIGIDNKAYTMGSFSKYCSSVETFNSENDLLSLLIDLRKYSHYKNSIFCESDKMLLFIDQYKDYLQEYYHLYIPSRNSLREIMNKNHMIELAQAAGIKTPITFSSTNISYDEIKDKIKFPVFIKPYFTQMEYRQKGLLAHDETILMRVLKSERFRDGYILQEIIVGHENNLWTCIGYCDKNADPVVLFTGHKLRQTPRDFGVATLAISKQNEKIKNLARIFLKHIHYTGCFELEFKKVEDEDEYVFIEINPRICSLNNMAIASGIDLPFIAYCDINGIPFERNIEQMDNIVWIYIIKDLVSCLRYYFKDDKSVLLDWLKKVLTSHSYAVFDFHDIKPFIYDTGRYFLKTLRSIFRS